MQEKTTTRTLAVPKSDADIRLPETSGKLLNSGSGAPIESEDDTRVVLLMCVRDKEQRND